MASKASKKMPPMTAPLPECPVCLDVMVAPIYQCKTGHSICNSCRSQLIPYLCPMCRQEMSMMRNFALEELVAKAKVSCPNRTEGCVYTMATEDVEDHLSDCIFKKMDCPLKEFRMCTWHGKLKDMMQHFKDRHASHCNVSSDCDIELDIATHEPSRFVLLAALGKILFIITIKYDNTQKMAFWAVQYIGSRKGSQQYSYEIHITSKKDYRKKAVFTEQCFNDAIKSDEIFRLGKCGMMPLLSLNNFMNNRKLAFRYLIKRSGPQNKPAGNKSNKPAGNK